MPEPMRSPLDAVVLHPNAPAAYPPVLHLLAALRDAGWSLQLIGASGDDGLDLPEAVMRGIGYVDLCTSAGSGRGPDRGRLAGALLDLLRRPPRLLIASDPLTAGPALLLAAVRGTPVVYLEHDSPCPDPVKEGRPLRRWLRHLLLQTAALRVFPTADRLAFAQGEVGFHRGSAVVMPNLPNVPPDLSMPVRGLDDGVRRLHFHGSISPLALPMALIPALASRPGWTLDVYGYAIGHRDHLEAWLAAAAAAGIGERIRFHGAVPNSRLHEVLAYADAAFAGFRPHPFNLNHTLIDGASNKLHEYAWHGLPTLVPEDMPRVEFPAALALPYRREEPQSIVEALDRAAERQPDRRWRPPTYAAVCRERLLPRLDALREAA